MHSPFVFDFVTKGLYQKSLKSVLSNHAEIDRLEEQDGKLLVYPKKDIAASELNAYLFQNNIILEHLVKRKNSLEEQFLELTNNN